LQFLFIENVQVGETTLHTSANNTKIT